MTNPPKTPIKTRFGIIILLGDYILPRGKEFWLNDMLTLLKLVGIPERTGRSTLSRMADDGWFEVSSVGRQRKFRVTPWAENVLRQGDLRVFENELTEWDGTWQLAIYSLPESKRVLRNTLRKQLMWLGYAMLTPGSWISPHDRQASLEQILVDLDAVEYVHFFSGEYSGAVPIEELVQTSWDLGAIGSSYDNFLETHRPVLENLWQQQDTITPETALIHRFRLSCDFVSLLQQDPNLPSQFLPEGWPGNTARRFYKEWRTRLHQRSIDYNGSRSSP